MQNEPGMDKPTKKLNEDISEIMSAIGEETKKLPFNEIASAGSCWWGAGGGVGLPLIDTRYLYKAVNLETAFDDPLEKMCEYGAEGYRAVFAAGYGGAIIIMEKVVDEE